MAKKTVEKKFTSIPYYVPAKNIAVQLSQASDKRKTSIISFIIIKLRNWLLQWLAYNCPVNSIRIQLHRWRGVTIGKGVMLGMHCILDNAHPEYILIEDFAALAGNNYVITHSNPYLHFKGRLISYLAPVIVRKGAWVGVSSTLLPGCELGECSIVSAGSTASGKIPPNVIVCGNPAVVIREFKVNEEIFSCYK
ncbi:MAG: acyltransferase [Candidatus Cloacimonetes bacterium]|nr:acyltransferase [Candidatus Cloacimonadota bacterium]